MTKRELLNANITHVSYVNKGANQKKFFLTKSEDKPNFEKQVKVFTKNEAEKLVYGVVYSPDETDAHGDFMKAEEIEKSAHQFLKDARNIDNQHNFEAGAGEVVESYVAPSDIMIGTDSITKGSWILVTKATDEIWESIQKGDITGYSMAGTAETVEVEKAEDETQMKSFFQTMKAFFSPAVVEKGAVKDAFYGDKKKREFFDAMHIFEDLFYRAVWDGDVTKVKEHAQDLADLMQDIANSPDIMKALGNIEKSKEVISVKKEDFQALLKEEMKSIVEKVEALEKAQEPVVADPAVTATVEKTGDSVVEQEDLIKSFTEVLKAELAPLADRIDKVEKARGISKQAEEQEEKLEKSDETVSVFESLFRTN